jgi:hypothetical protein
MAYSRLLRGAKCIVISKVTHYLHIDIFSWRDVEIDKLRLIQHHTKRMSRLVHRRSFWNAGIESAELASNHLTTLEYQVDQAATITQSLSKSENS